MEDIPTSPSSLLHHLLTKTFNLSMVVTLVRSKALKCKVESENNLPQVVTVFIVLIEKYLEI